jgi:hypothetical protein
MENVETAEEVLSAYLPGLLIVSDGVQEVKVSKALEAMKCYARLHVEAALKSAAENARTSTRGCSDGHECWDVTGVDKDSILRAYPLDKIV